MNNRQLENKILVAKGFITMLTVCVVVNIMQAVFYFLSGLLEGFVFVAVAAFCGYAIFVQLTLIKTLRSLLSESEEESE